MLSLESHSLDWLLSASQTEETASSGGDTFILILLGLLVLFFGWLIVASIRKKLSSSKGRIGDYKDEDETAQTAQLWAEARRKTAEKEETESEEAEPEEEISGEDIQTELLEKARLRRETTDQEPKVSPPETSPATPKEIKAPPSEIQVLPRSLEEGLRKTREGFVAKLGRLFGRSALGEDVLEEIEEILFTADIGVRTSKNLIDFLQKELKAEERADPRLLFGALQKKIEQMLHVAVPPPAEPVRPRVILMVGVNGTGKTTTIGKLALQYARAGQKVFLAAADTFRAAAQEQLQIWGQRAGAQVITGQEGADPGAVVFDTITAAKNQGGDIVIADTAGRLHTKVNLVEELRKVHRVCGKAMPGAPHEVLLVLDATTGQNAINQAKEFHQALNVTGMVLTKLDGTAKGGIIIGVCDTFKIPVRYIGIGESVEDLREFEAAPFVKALFS